MRHAVAALHAPLGCVSDLNVTLVLVQARDVNMMGRISSTKNYFLSFTVVSLLFFGCFLFFKILLFKGTVFDRCKTKDDKIRPNQSNFAYEIHVCWQCYGNIRISI